MTEEPIRYCYSSNEENFSGECDSREDAIAEAISEEVVDPGSTFWTGRQERPAADPGMDAMDALERAHLRATEDMVDDYGEGWLALPKTGTPERVELDAICDEFNARVIAWAEKHDPPSWWRVEDVQEHVMPACGTPNCVDGAIPSQPDGEPVPRPKCAAPGDEGRT